MAKKAKKELTPEERLAAARVPKEEWPYELPEGWEWVRLGGVCEASKEKTEDFSDESLKYIGLEHMEKNEGIVGVGSASELKSTKSVFHPGQILYGKLRPYLNKHDIVDFAGVCSTDILVFRVSPEVFPKFVNFYFDQQFFLEYAVSNSKGINLPRVSEKVIMNAPFPLPPLETQQRIVDHIETLFAKLDQAKEKAQQALATSETRKAAILHQSFTGQLTAQWREDNGVSMETWEEVSSDQLFEYVTSGSRGWAKYYSDQGDLFLRMGNLDHGTIKLDLSEIQHVALPLKAEGQRSKLQKNDILISITADVGMVGLVKDDIEGDAFINQHLALARPIAEHNAEFLAWYLVSDLGQRQLFKKQRGATKIGLGLDDIQSLLLKIPKIDEQQEIVRILDDLLAKEQRIQQAVETILQQIDDTKKSILAKAFRGEWFD